MSDSSDLKTFRCNFQKFSEATFTSLSYMAYKCFVSTLVNCEDFDPSFEKLFKFMEFKLKNNKVEWYEFLGNFYRNAVKY